MAGPGKRFNPLLWIFGGLGWIGQVLSLGSLAESFRSATAAATSLVAQYQAAVGTLTAEIVLRDQRPISTLEVHSGVLVVTVMTAYLLADVANNDEVRRESWSRRIAGAAFVGALVAGGALITDVAPMNFFLAGVYALIGSIQIVSRHERQEIRASKRRSGILFISYIGSTLVAAVVMSQLSIL